MLFELRVFRRLVLFCRGLKIPGNPQGAMNTMQDILYTVVVVVFFAATAAYVRGCDKL